jgi:predicted ATPase
MIKKLRLKFGKSPGSAVEEILTTPVTVFVGPNNSGKSKILSEIHRFCESGQTNTLDVILDAIEFGSLSEIGAEDRVSHITLKPNVTESLLPEHVIVGERGARTQVSRKELVAALQNTNQQTRLFCNWYLQYNTLMLDGQSRISLINHQSAGDLQHPTFTRSWDTGGRYCRH